jgi:hypothetical protein
MIVVAPTVPQTQAKKIAKLNATSAALAVNQIGVRKGRRWKLTWSLFMRISYYL